SPSASRSFLRGAAPGSGFVFAVEAAFGLDVDLPAGQLRGEAGVLALVADCERKLAVRHGDLAGVRAVRRGLDGEDRGRRERGGHDLLRLVAVIDDVHLLAAELVDDVRDARAAGADAGADRVDVRVVADNRDLRSGAGLAGDGLDLDRAVEDL